MIKTKYILSFLGSIMIIVFLGTCKKNVPFYGISDAMKEYFVYQKGSYWIYKDDSTGIIDSTYVNSFYHTTEDNNYSEMTREVISLYFKSQFLSAFEIQYVHCAGPDYFQLTSRLNPLVPPTEIEVGGPVAYYPGWPPNTKITSQGCIPRDVFIYKYLQKDTINNVIYNNIIYSKIQTIDSSSTNPIFYFREIYFAKNIGIIKYSEVCKYCNIRRSYTLVRKKIIQ